MFKKLLLIASVMVVASPFTYAVGPDGKDEKSNARHSPKARDKKVSSGGGSEKLLQKRVLFLN